MADRHWHITGKVLTAAIAIALLVAGAAFVAIVRHGLSSRDNPTMLEETLARLTRRFAMPASTRALRNPVPLIKASSQTAEKDAATGLAFLRYRRRTS